jgi:NAD-dependent dihydropyrimidine dehydrogenase PreA subunit
MAYVISETCDNCGTCKESCPSDAIHEGEKQHTINMEECIECGACIAACPNEAISEV